MIRYTCLCSLAAVLATVGLSAQTVVLTGETMTAIGVHADHPSHSATHKSLPKGQKFTNGLRVRTDSGDCHAEIRADISGAQATVAFQGQVAGNQTTTNGTSKSFADPTTLVGSPRFRFMLRSDKPVTGRVIAKMTPRAAVWWGYNTYVSATVQVPNLPVMSTNSIWAAAVTKEFAVTLGPAGTEVEVTLGCRGRSLSQRVTYGMTIELSFEAGPQVTSYGKSCGHAWSSFQGNTMQLTYQMGLHRSPTVLVFGLRRTELQLPPHFSGCKLLVDPILIVPGGRTSGIGLANASWRVPSSAATFLVQAIGLDTPQRFLSTNGVAVQL